MKGRCAVSCLNLLVCVTNTSYVLTLNNFFLNPRITCVITDTRLQFHTWAYTRAHKNTLVITEQKYACPFLTQTIFSHWQLILVALNQLCKNDVTMEAWIFSCDSGCSTKLVERTFKVVLQHNFLGILKLIVFDSNVRNAKPSINFTNCFILSGVCTF